jgi:hypothetical protein
VAEVPRVRNAVEGKVEDLGKENFGLVGREVMYMGRETLGIVQ